MKESKNLECKETIQSNTFLKTVSAFANYGTGRIVFGIDDDGQVKGIKNTIDDCLSIENKMNDNMNPVPVYDLNINDDSTITLTVYEVTSNLIYIKEKHIKDTIHQLLK